MRTLRTAELLAKRARISGREVLGSHERVASEAGGAVISKVFPGLVLIPLPVQGRWRAVGWTAAFIAVFTSLTWFVPGPSPFMAFWDGHLPRLQGGETFAFAHCWPVFPAEIIACNQTPFSMVAKSNELGVPAMTDKLARSVDWVYSSFILGLAIWAARDAAGRTHQAQVWFALLTLAVLRSSGAFLYHVVGSLWLLTLIAVEMPGHRWPSVSLGICWVFLFFLPGVVPLPVFSPPPLMMILSGLGVVRMVTLNS